jgi:hypothetical protein
MWKQASGMFDQLLIFLRMPEACDHLKEQERYSSTGAMFKAQLSPFWGRSQA